MKSTKQRYGLRKLSIGVVSCFLGSAIYLGASMNVQAEEVDPSDNMEMENEEDSLAAKETDGTQISIEEENVLKTADALPPKVIQKDPVEGFIEGLPNTTIYIDSNVIGKNVESLKGAEFEQGKLFDDVAGFVYGEDVSGYGDYENEISFDFSKYAFTDSNSTVTEYSWGTGSNQKRNVFTRQFEGILGTYKWEKAAYHINENSEIVFYDVYLEYSNPLITAVMMNLTDYNNSKNAISKGKVGLINANSVRLGNNDRLRYGFEVVARPYILDKKGNLVEGDFLFPMVDIDVVRGGNLRELSNAALYNASDVNNYSEQVVLQDGFSAIYIPSDAYNNPDGSSSEKDHTKLVYDETKKTYQFVANRSNADDTYDSGFAAVAINGEFSYLYRGSGSRDQNGITLKAMESYMLSGVPVNHLLKHSTEVGGKILTTVNGNGNGLLDDSNLIQPTVIATRTGQSVTYTFLPDEGYELDSVWVSNIGTDYTKGTQITDFDSFDDNGDGTFDRYTYTFSAIGSDNAIHVSWKKLPTPPQPDPVVPTPDPVVPTPDPVVPTPTVVTPTPEPTIVPEEKEIVLPEIVEEKEEVKEEVKEEKPVVTSSVQTSVASSGFVSTMLLGASVILSMGSKKRNK